MQEKEKLVEMAHTRTVKACKEQNIPISVRDDTGTLVYTEQAQDLFNAYYDELERDTLPVIH